MHPETAHILVVDDDTRLRGLLRKFLMDNGFRVSVAADAKDARDHLASLEFDLIVLDRMMPGEDGLTLAHALKSDHRMPILMLTAMAEVEHRIDGLEAGVADYLPKPFEPRELLLRIKNILQRAPAEPTISEVEVKIVQLGDIRFDAERELLIGADDTISLTSTEASLLRVLAEQAGRVMSRKSLSQLCDINGGERTIDVQVTRLRRKIEPNPRTPRYLQTIRGQGYVLRPDE